MIDAVAGLPPVVQVLLATGFTWGITALGAGLVFFTNEVKRYVLDAMLGFAAGVMIAASYFSLLAPTVEFAEAGGGSPWIPAVVGFLGGGSSCGASTGYCRIFTPGARCGRLRA